jgi:hypothetical protein
MFNVEVASLIEPAFPAVAVVLKIPLLGSVLKGAVGTPVGEVPEIEIEFAATDTSPPAPVAKISLLLAIWPPRVSVNVPTCKDTPPARPVPSVVVLMNPLSTSKVGLTTLIGPISCASA